jgi:2-amino-4-hydroxy-6-hydroxymethyldihydropteridine diphosphokinase
VNPDRPGAHAARIGYLGLGSNVGERLEQLRAARDRLAALDTVDVLRASSVYETEAVAGAADQGDFLNACLEVETGLAPDRLLDVCKEVERALGRRPGPRHGPRLVDVDLLLLGDLEHAGERLTLPHPGILGRRFVLLPLLELEPALRLPDGRALAGSLEAVAGQRAERIGDL